MKLPDLKLNVDRTALCTLPEKLRNAGYQEHTIIEFLRLTDSGEMIAKHLPYYQHRCRQDDSDLAKLISLFLLGGGVDRSTLQRLLGSEAVGALIKCGVLLGFSGVFSSQVALFPCLGDYFFTDYWFAPGQETEGKVYEIGTDSYVLARVTPRHANKQALDLCTGSGIHAIQSAALGASQAVDINPRAARYAELNAALNGVDIEIHLGDLYSALPESAPFDLITANPPFVPSPDPVVLIHRRPGETGEEVSERIVAGLPEHLAEGGLFSMILEHPVIAGDDYSDRLERWLGQDHGWGIAVLWYVEKTPAEYIAAHMGPVESFVGTFNRYLESYQTHGIEAIRFANVFIVRLPSDQPNWKVTQRTVWPKQEFSEQVRFWLECLTQYNDPKWRPDPSWKPKLSRYYKAVWQDWNEERGALEMTPDNPIPADELNRAETKLMMKMRSGERSIAELQDEWGDKACFLTTLRSLGRLRALSPYSPNGSD